MVGQSRMASADVLPRRQGAQGFAIGALPAKSQGNMSCVPLCGPKPHLRLIRECPSAPRQPVQNCTPYMAKRPREANSLCLRARAYVSTASSSTRHLPLAGQPDLTLCLHGFTLGGSGCGSDLAALRCPTRWPSTTRAAPRRFPLPRRQAHSTSEPPSWPQLAGRNQTRNGVWLLELRAPAPPSFGSCQRQGRRSSQPTALELVFLSASGRTSSPSCGATHFEHGVSLLDGLGKAVCRAPQAIAEAPGQARIHIIQGGCLVLCLARVRCRLFPQGFARPARLSWSKDAPDNTPDLIKRICVLLLHAIHQLSRLTSWAAAPPCAPAPLTMPVVR